MSAGCTTTTRKLTERKQLKTPKASEENPVRVYAVVDVTPEQVRYLGTGNYVGDHIPPGFEKAEEPNDEEREIISQMVAESIERIDREYREETLKAFDEGSIDAEQRDEILAELDETTAKARAVPMEERVQTVWDRTGRNPKIVLDTGEVVWGYQCWWAEWEEGFDPAKKWPGRKIVPTTMAEAVQTALEAREEANN